MTTSISTYLSSTNTSGFHLRLWFLKHESFVQRFSHYLTACFLHCWVVTEVSLHYQLARQSPWSCQVALWLCLSFVFCVKQGFIIISFHKCCFVITCLEIFPAKTRCSGTFRNIQGWWNLDWFTDPFRAKLFARLWSSDFVQVICDTWQYLPYLGFLIMFGRCCVDVLTAARCTKWP